MLVLNRRFILFRFIPLLFSSAILWLVLSSSVSARIYKYVDSNGIVTYSERKPSNGRFKTINLECLHFGRGCPSGRRINYNNTPLNLAAFKNEVNRAAKKHGVKASLIRAVIHAESSFNPKAVSHVGAQGLMQIMPATQREEGLRQPFNPVANINAGTKILARLLKRYHGDFRLASAAYHAGEGAVAKYGGIPPYSSTQTYVQRISILQKRYEKS